MCRNSFPISGAWRSRAPSSPTVSEGRGYTQGRLLRERWQFGGELRARGALQRDHVFLLARCGFDSIELPESELEGGVAALGTFTAAYQPANDRGLRAGPRLPRGRAAGRAPLTSSAVHCRAVTRL